MGMPADVDFNLTEEGFRNYERLLAEQDITAYPKARDTVEDPEKILFPLPSLGCSSTMDASSFTTCIKTAIVTACRSTHSNTALLQVGPSRQLWSELSHSPSASYRYTHKSKENGTLCQSSLQSASLA